jgi:steroid 5-alpha reductase family enzyme
MMRKKAKLLLKKIADGDDYKYKQLKKSWKGLSWIEKTKMRQYIESN